MRGCLGVLVIAATFLVAAIWFGGPPLAGAAVQAGLTGAGFEADKLEVEVAAAPPLRLAVGHADEVHIEATGVRWNELRAGSMDLRLGDVDLVNRTVGTADGTLSDVDLGGSDGEPVAVQIALTGAASAARTTILVTGASIDQLVRAAFSRELGVQPDSATLQAPDTLVLQVGGLAASGRLAVDAGGAVVVSTPLGTVRLVVPDASIPLHLTGLSVESGGLLLSGTLNVEEMLGP